MSTLKMADSTQFILDNYDKQGCLHEQFIKQAKTTPEAVAVVCPGGRKVTYGELERMTEELAIKLQHLGVKTNAVVGILMDRSLEYVVSYFAILRAGGAYMPIDVSYTPALLKAILEDARPLAICTKTPFLERLIGAATIPVLLDEGWQDTMKEDNRQFGPPPTPRKVSLDDLSFIIYTSGTTGKPKGIQWSHRVAVMKNFWRQTTYQYGEGERDAVNLFFAWLLMTPLVKGATMYIIPDDVVREPPRLVQYLQDNKITRIMFTPSLIQAVLDFKGLELEPAFKLIRQLWLCGEVVTIKLRNRLAKLVPHVQLIIQYSSSETQEIASADLSAGKMKSSSNKFCPVGTPIPGVNAVIMDDEMNVLPAGTMGELYIGGPTLTTGYLNQPELTAQRFIQRPKHVSPEVGERLYRTGDWAYLQSDGNLQICGRCDTTVKIRGYRIGLQEVESALLELPMVNTACVLAHGDEGSDKMLVAYIVPKGKTSRNEVRAALKETLPFYMVPAKFIFLKSMPMSPSGKLNKNALTKILDLIMDETVEPLNLPSTPTACRISAIWCRVLKLNAVDVHESFFDLGGHSLLAVHLLSELNETLGTQLVLSDLIQHPTISSLSNFIKDPTRNSSKLDLKNELEKHKQGWTLPENQLQTFQLHESTWQFNSVFLTGVTGFVGAFVLKELLLRTQAKVFCLVRKTPGSTAMDRVWESLRKFGINDAGLSEILEHRVVAVCGDVSLQNMGIEKGLYATLSQEVDCIIHSAAAVNLVHPYQALHGANVQGTQNIVEFACRHKMKVLQYISSVAVFAQGFKDCSEDTDMMLHADTLETGYAQTKWLAEQLVFFAQEKGLPVAIHRCGNVAGSRDDAGWNPVDFTLLMLQACLHTSTVPDIDWKIELSPVDFVSQVVVDLSQNSLSSVGKTYHLINPSTMHCRELWGLLQEQGYPVQVVSYNEWYQNVKEAAKQCGQLLNLLYILDGLIRDPSFFGNMPTFTPTGLVQEQGLSYPPVDTDLMRKYVKTLASVGLVPPPSSS